MSRWPSRSAAEVMAVAFLAAAVLATPFLTASTTTFLEVVCAACFVVFAYLLLTRRWWPAVAAALVSGQPALNLINHDRSSHLEHLLAVGVGLAGVAIIFIGSVRQRSRPRESQRSR
jgi:hypothetical protein